MRFLYIVVLSGSQIFLIYFGTKLLLYVARLNMYRGIFRVFKRLLHGAAIFVIAAIFAWIFLLNSSFGQWVINERVQESTYILLIVLVFVDLVFIFAAFCVWLCTLRYRN